MNFLKKKTKQNFTEKLDELINHLKQTCFLTESKVESAIKQVPRHFFVPDSMQDRAYENEPLPIMNGQTISQPSVVARMTEWLDVKPGQKILEIGSGSGWQCAIIAKLVEDGQIFTVERHENLSNFARKNLERSAINNAQIINGDGRLGLPSKTPFDRIIITAACKEVPKTLLEQLAIDGMLIAPIGEKIQSLVLFRKTTKGIVEVKRQEGYVFVPLV